MSKYFSTLSANPTREDFEYFIKLFYNELILNSMKEEHKVLQLINHLGRDGLEIFEVLPLPKKTYEEAVDRLHQWFLTFFPFAPLT